MKIILALSVLGILALAGSRRVLFDRHVPLGARLIFLTGTEFIIVGLILGEQYLGLLDASTLSSLTPLAGVCLGWVGLLFGMQFDKRSLSSLPKSYFSVSVFQSTVTLAIVFGVFFVLLGLTQGKSFLAVLPAAATLAAAGACSGQAGLAMVQQRFPNANRQVLSLLRYLAGIDALPALLIFGIATSLCVNCPGVLGQWGGILRLVLGLCLAVLMAIILFSLARERTSQSDLLLLLMGVCGILGGLAHQTGVSVLFLSMVCGIVVANLSPLRTRMSDLLAGGEKFIYFVLLILAGAHWDIPGFAVLGLAGVYVCARLVGKISATYFATRKLKKHLPLPSFVGLGLVTQAGMALAVVIDFHQTGLHVLGDLVLTVAIVGIILSELFGPALAVLVTREQSPASGEAS